nr:hypothetical protein [Tanacetum cinerariifolium]
MQLNYGAIGADDNPADFQSVPAKANVGSSPSLSIATDSPINQGKASVKTRQIAILATDGADDFDAVRFVNEAFRHCKPLAASAEGVELLKAAAYPGAEDILEAEGVVTSSDTDVATLAEEFAAAIKQHRFWSR